MKGCRKVRSRLHMLAENELDPGVSEEILAHIADCPDCSAKYDELVDLKALIERTADAKLTAPDVTQAVLEGVDRAVSVRRWRRSRGFFKKALIAAAACLAAAVVGIYLFAHSYFGRIFPEQIGGRVLRCSRGIETMYPDGRWKPLKAGAALKRGQKIRMPVGGRSFMSFDGVRLLSDGAVNIEIDGSRRFSMSPGSLTVEMAPKDKPLRVSLGEGVLVADDSSLNLRDAEGMLSIDCVAGTATFETPKGKQHNLTAGQRAVVAGDAVRVALADMRNPIAALRVPVIERIRQRFHEVISQYSTRIPDPATVPWLSRNDMYLGPEWMEKGLQFASYVEGDFLNIARADAARFATNYYEALFVPSNRTLSLGKQKVVPLEPGAAASFPRWSHDGSMLAFIELQIGTFYGRARIVRLDDLENSWDVSQEYDTVRPMFPLTWAPDDRHVLFQVQTGNAWDERGPTGNFQIKIAPIDPAEGPLRDFESPFHDIPLVLPLPVGKNISPSIAKLPWGDAMVVANWGNFAYIPVEEDGQAVAGAPGMFLTNFNPRECFVMGGGFSPSGSMMDFTGVENFDFNHMNSYILYDVEDILDGFAPPPRSLKDPRIKRAAPTENMQFTGGFSFDESLVFVHEDVSGTFDARFPTDITSCDFDVFYANALPEAPPMPVQIHQPGNQMFIEASPEGNRLVYCNYEGFNAELRVVNFDSEADIDVDLGGVLIDNSGTNLIVPPGTLENNFKVKISTPIAIGEEAELSVGESHFFAMRLIDAQGLENPSFAEPMTLTIRYTDDEIPGLEEGMLEIYYYDESDPDHPVWVPLGGTVDPEHNEITTEIRHFSKFSVGGKRPEGQAEPRPETTPPGE